MNKTLETAPTQSPERSESHELSRPNILKSAELFNGDINAAVIRVQQTMGLEITPEWWSENVGEANNDLDTAERFDKAFKKEFEAREWRNQGVPEEKITAIQGHEDYDSDPNTVPQQINGINIPYEVIEGEGDPALWAAEEAKRRENYIFNEAKFHLDYQFEIGGVLYYVDGIYYTGTDGEYETLAIDIKKVDPTDSNDGFEREVSIEDIENRIKTGETPVAAETETSEESASDDVAAIKQHELELYDERFPGEENADDRKKFEEFLDEFFDDRQSLDDDPDNMPEGQEDYIEEHLEDSSPEETELLSRHPLPDQAIDELQAARDNLDKVYEEQSTIER